MKIIKRNIPVWGKKTISILFTIFIFTTPILAQVTKDKSGITQNPCKILFIGSSYFNYNNLPNLFENFAVNAVKEVYIDQCMPSGLYLSDHASSTVTELKINEKDWDYVVLQGVGSVTAYPDSFTAHPVYPALEKLKNKIYKNCESTKMIFCLPWAFEDGMTWYGWPDTYEDMQIKIYDNTLQYSNNIDFPIAPVGWAWYKVLDELNYPLHYLHLSDWNHPSLKGSYLMACVIFSTIFQESSINNTYYAGLPEEDANYFQIVASNTVMDSLDLWNISPNTGLNDVPKIPNFQLFQNYPNPFRSLTMIKFELNEDDFVKLNIYDIFGNLHKSIANEHKTKGIHLFQFDGNKLKNGLYFCTMKTENFVSTRKILIFH